MFKKILSIALLLCALCACKKTPIDDVIPVTSVSLNQTEAEMNVGETQQLQAQISPSNATDKTLMWGSSKQSVATVSDAGLVTAVGEGTSKITVTASGKTATCVVTVTKPDTPVETVHVESVSLDRETAALEIGETLVLTATVLPANADDKSLTWKSSNPEIAEVDQNGNVTAISSGTVTITATTTDGGKVAGCEVTVTAAFIPVESVTFDLDEYIIFPGVSFKPIVTVLPENATNKTITWSSSDAGAVSVTQDGIVTGHAEAFVTITAKAGDKEATCIIHCVHNPDEDDEHDGEDNGHYWMDLGLPSGIKWATCNVGADNSAQVGSRFAWGETFARESSENPPYTWYNSATGKYTKYVTDAWYGNVDNLTTLEPQDDAAHAQWGGEWRMPSEADVMELIDNTNLEFVQQNNVWGAKLTSKNNAHSIFIPNKDYHTSSLRKGADNCSTGFVFWDNIDIASLERGLICSVRAVIGTTAYVPVEAVEADYSSVYMVVGETHTLSVRVLPDDATDKTVTWSSNDESVAVVDNNGNVTAKGAGYTQVRASAGGKEFYFYVNVRPRLESVKIVPENLTLGIDESATVSIQVTPPEAFQYHSFGYSNRSYDVISVERSGDIFSSEPPTFTITAKAGGEGTFVYFTTISGEEITATCHVTVPYIDDYYDGETDGHKWVDFGLPSGTKWATCNVGAYYANKLGPLYSWGEGENDPAKANWGGGWRMPTEDDLYELLENVTYEWTEYQGEAGMKLTSKNNGHSLFLAADEPYIGKYLTSTLDKGRGVGIIFTTSGHFGKTWYDLDEQHPVRAVIGNTPYIPVESVSFDYSHDFMKVGDTKKLQVDISPSNATNKKITWSSSNESVAVVDNHGKLTAVGVGKALIYAKVDGKTDYIILAVDPVVTATFEPASLTLKVGESAEVTVRLEPDVALSTYGLDQSTPWIINVEEISDSPYIYRVTALSEGTGKFTFEAGGSEFDYYVTVTND